MAANKVQGTWFAIFLAGLTITCAGIAVLSGGLGKFLLLAGRPDAGNIILAIPQN